MSSKLGTLTLDLVARIGQFVAPMEEAREVATEVTSEIEEGFTTASLAAKVFGAILAGLSVGAVYDYVNSLMEAGYQLSSFSKLANSSVEQFQYYAKGAVSAGISMEQFADQMKDMQDRIGDFQQSGGGPLADFFENIAPLVGVTIQQFQKLSGPEALQLFYDSLQKVGATENDIKFYMESIIGDSSKLIPLLENGGEGFKKWGDNAVAAGSIVSESTANALADANESVQLMMESWTGFKVEMAENVAPVITGVIDNFDTVKAVAVALGAAIATKLVVQLGILSIEFVKGVVEGVRYQMALAAMAGQTITLTSATAALRTAMWSLIGGPAGLAILAVQVLAAGAAFLYMKKASDEVKPSLDSQGLSIKELITDFENLSEAARRSQLRFEDNKLSDLSDSYDDAKSKLISLVISMGRFDDSSDDAVKKANALAMQYKQGNITAEQLASKISALAGTSAEAKTKIDEQTVAVAKVKAEMDKQQQVTEALTNKNGQLANAHDRISASVNAQAKAYLSLTQKQREALNGVNSDIEKSQYIQANMAAGWSRDKAEFYADYRSNAGLGFMGKALSPFEIETVDQGFKLQQSTKAREESEKNIENLQKKQADALKKQNEEAAKKYQYTVKEQEMLRRVAELASKNGLNAIGAKYGVPENLLAAVMAQESKGNVNAKSSTGAIGPFQTTGIYRENYGLSVKDSYDVKKSAEIAAKDLASSFKIFGNWTDAVTAYNAGVSGTQSLLKSGFTGGAAKTEEAKEYAGKVNKWFVGLNGSDAKDSGFYGEKQSESLKDYQAFLDKTEQLRVESEARQVATVRLYADEEQQIHLDNLEAIKSIENAFTIDDSIRQKYIDLQKIVYQKDLEAFKKAQLQKQFEQLNSLKSMQAQIQSLSAGSDDIFAKATMSPQDYATWSLKNNRDNSQLALKDQLVSTEQSIATSDSFSNENDRYQALLDAHQEYLYQKNALDIQYDQQVKELAASQQQEQLSLLSGILSNTQTTFAQLTQSAKDGAGEQSAIYQTMFAMQQGFSVASSLVAAWTAYTQAFADPSAMTLPQKFLGATSVMAALAPALATISSVSITGMAHDGIDNIPKEGTWLLDGGERVLNPNQNKDLTNYLSQAQSNNTQAAPNVNLNPNFVIVDERQSLGDYLYGPDGKKAFVKFFKQNRRELGLA